MRGLGSYSHSVLPETFQAWREQSPLGKPCCHLRPGQVEGTGEVPRVAVTAEGSGGLSSLEISEGRRSAMTQ